MNVIYKCTLVVYVDMHVLVIVNYIFNKQDKRKNPADKETNYADDFISTSNEI